MENKNKIKIASRVLLNKLGRAEIEEALQEGSICFITDWEREYYQDLESSNINNVQVLAHNARDEYFNSICRYLLSIVDTRRDLWIKYNVTSLYEFNAVTGAGSQKKEIRLIVIKPELKLSHLLEVLIEKGARHGVYVSIVANNIVKELNIRNTTAGEQKAKKVNDAEYKEVRVVEVGGTLVETYSDKNVNSLPSVDFKKYHDDRNNPIEIYNDKQVYGSKELKEDLLKFQGETLVFGRQALYNSHLPYFGIRVNAGSLITILANSYDSFVKMNNIVKCNVENIDSDFNYLDYRRSPGLRLLYESINEDKPNIFVIGEEVDSDTEKFLKERSDFIVVMFDDNYRNPHNFSLYGDSSFDFKGVQIVDKNGKSVKLKPYEISSEPVNSELLSFSRERL